MERASDCSHQVPVAFAEQHCRVEPRPHRQGRSHAQDIRSAAVCAVGRMQLALCTVHRARDWQVVSRVPKGADRCESRTARFSRALLRRPALASREGVQPTDGDRTALAVVGASTGRPRPAADV